MKLLRTSLLIPQLVLFSACSSKDAAPEAAGTSETASPASAAATDIPVTAGPEPTATELSNYKLDMDKMRRFTAAMRGFTEASKKDSTLAIGMSTGSGASTEQLITTIENNRLARNVLRRAGLSAKEYVWITGAWLQAAMTAGIMEASPQAKLPEGQNPQNIEFLKANKAEIEAMMKEAGADM